MKPRRACLGVQFAHDLVIIALYLKSRGKRANVVSDFIHQAHLEGHARLEGRGKNSEHIISLSHELCAFSRFFAFECIRYVR